MEKTTLKSSKIRRIIEEKKILRIFLKICHEIIAFKEEKTSLVVWNL